MKPLMLQNSVVYCVKEGKPCIGWVEHLFKDCLCNLRDDLSFALGLISVVCWALAEIPQIITNFRTKSSHGISLLFLLTWIVGDIFNLVGCLLEPATLPTQFYTALFYTVNTVVLVFQGIYYGHICRWLKKKQIHANLEVEEDIEPFKPQNSGDLGIPIPDDRVRASPRKDYYYTSARSLAGSATPPMRSYLWNMATKSGPSAVELDNDSSSDDETIQVPSNKSITQPKPISRSVGFGAFLATSVNLPPQTKALVGAYVGFGGRILLQENEMENNVYGQCLGWMMAAIYMGGRVPQIWLNIKRGSVEGLNPLMFIFALVGNATYVGSILVRTAEWDKIKANMPWLLDAVVCVVLDLFIISQYIYYKCNERTNTNAEEDYGDYFEEDKIFIA